MYREQRAQPVVWAGLGEAFDALRGVIVQIRLSQRDLQLAVAQCREIVYRTTRGAGFTRGLQQSAQRLAGNVVDPGRTGGADDQWRLGLSKWRQAEQQRGEAGTSVSGVAKCHVLHPPRYHVPGPGERWRGGVPGAGWLPNAGALC